MHWKLDLGVTSICLCGLIGAFFSFSFISFRLGLPRLAVVHRAVSYEYSAWKKSEAPGTAPKQCLRSAVTLLRSGSIVIRDKKVNPGLPWDTPVSSDSCRAALSI